MFCKIRHCYLKSMPKKSKSFSKLKQASVFATYLPFMLKILQARTTNKIQIVKQSNTKTYICLNTSYHKKVLKNQALVLEKHAKKFQIYLKIILSQCVCARITITAYSCATHGNKIDIDCETLACSSQKQQFSQKRFVKLGTGT